MFTLMDPHDHAHTPLAGTKYYDRNVPKGNDGHNTEPAWNAACETCGYRIVSTTGSYAWSVPLAMNAR